MNRPAPERFLEALEATWPPAARERIGPFVIRRGEGGGQRVSAATLAAPDFTAPDIDAAIAAMRGLGQRPLFMIREGEEALDLRLRARGFTVTDEARILAAPAAQVARPGVPPASVFRIWPPLAVMRELWAEADVGPARLAVMQRVSGPRTGLLARHADRAAGIGFVALDGDIAFLHALAVTERLRRGGAATNILREAATWAQDMGASWLAVATTGGNLPAQALFRRAGLEKVTAYHYVVEKR